MCQQVGMGASDGQVVGLDGDGVEDTADKRGPFVAVSSVGEVDPRKELRCTDGGDGHVVVIIDDPVQVLAGAFGGDQDFAVQDQSCHERSCVRNDALIAASSLCHCGSAG